VCRVGSVGELMGGIMGVWGAGMVGIAALHRVVVKRLEGGWGGCGLSACFVCLARHMCAYRGRVCSALVRRRVGW